MLDMENDLMIKQKAINDVLNYLARGKTVEETAQHFDIPVATVEAVIRWQQKERDKARQP